MIAINVEKVPQSNQPPIKVEVLEASTTKDIKPAPNMILRVCNKNIIKKTIVNPTYACSALSTFLDIAMTLTSTTTKSTSKKLAVFNSKPWPKKDFIGWMLVRLETISDIASNTPIQRIFLVGKVSFLSLIETMQYNIAETSVPIAITKVLMRSTATYCVGQKAIGLNIIVARNI